MKATHSTPILRTLPLAGWTATLGQSLIAPFLSVYANHLGASGFLAGCIFGVFSLACILFMPVFGRLSDRCGRKPLITTGLLLYPLVALALKGFPHIHSLLLIRFLQGIAAAMILPIVLAYAGDIAPEGCEGRTRGKLNAVLAMGLSSGRVIGGILKDAIGTRITSGMMVMTMMAPFTERWADRTSKRAFIVAGGLTASVGMPGQVKPFR